MCHDFDEAPARWKSAGFAHSMNSRPSPTTPLLESL
jgi:hypothetical protein